MPGPKTVPIDEPAARALLPTAAVHIGGALVPDASGERHTHVYPGDGKRSANGGWPATTTSTEPCTSPRRARPSGPRPHRASA